MPEAEEIGVFKSVKGSCQSGNDPLLLSYCKCCDSYPKLYCSSKGQAHLRKGLSQCIGNSLHVSHTSANKQPAKLQSSCLG